MKADGSGIALHHSLLCGAAAGYMYWLPTYPIDVIKSRIQADSLETPQNKGIVDAAMKVWRSSGVRGFFRGIAPCILRAGPANGATFAAYELAMRVLNRKE